MLKTKVKWAAQIWDSAVKNVFNYPIACNFMTNRKIPYGLAGYFASSDFPNGCNFEIDKPMFDRLKDVLFDRLLFPIKIPNGDIYGFASRSLNEQGAKWLYHSIMEEIPTQSLFYGMYETAQRLNNPPFCYVVEGITGCIAMWRMGFPTIAALGAKLTVEQAAVLVVFSKGIALSFDHDESGIHGTKQALTRLAIYGNMPKIYIPAGLGLDPEEAIKCNQSFITMNVANFFSHFYSEMEFKNYMKIFAAEEDREGLRHLWDKVVH